MDEIGSKITFTRYDGGHMIALEGTLQKLTNEFVVVIFIDENGKEHTCKFKRAPGRTAGWATPPHRFFRLNLPERVNLCHKDISLRRR